MTKRTVLDETPTYVVAREGTDLLASCRCGSGMMAPDKGLGRATVAAWKTQHQDCDAAPHSTPRGKGPA